MISAFHHRPKKWLRLLCWSLFTAGLLVKFAAPGLKISNRTFVIPQAMATEGLSLHPDKIVGKERLMQSISAILTAVGALGLAFCYRGVLFPGTPQPATNRSEGPQFGHPGPVK
jgi:hypothetical protein